jgi:hypothetical protein
MMSVNFNFHLLSVQVRDHRVVFLLLDGAEMAIDDTVPFSGGLNAGRIQVDVPATTPATARENRVFAHLVSSRVVFSVANKESVRH